LQLRACLLQLGEFAGCLALESHSDSKTKATGWNANLLKHGLQQCDLLGSGFGLDFVSVARNFFFKLLHVFAKLLECHGGFGDFFGDDATLLRGDLLGFAVCGRKLVHRALKKHHNNTKLKKAQLLACWLEMSSFSASPWDKYDKNFSRATCDFKMRFWSLSSPFVFTKSLRAAASLEAFSSTLVMNSPAFSTRA
jgi:hypothetical protein